MTVLDFADIALQLDTDAVIERLAIDTLEYLDFNPERDQPDAITDDQIGTYRDTDLWCAGGDEAGELTDRLLMYLFDNDPPTVERFNDYVRQLARKAVKDAEDGTCD